MNDKRLVNETLIFQCNLFSGIPLDQRDYFLQNIKKTYQYFDKDSYILHEGDEYAQLLILLEGEIRTEMCDEKGDCLPIEIIQSVNALAPGFLFSPLNQSPVTIISKSDCVIMKITKQQVLCLMREYESFMIEFIKCISSKVELLSKRIRISALRTIKAKLAFYLLREACEADFVTLKIPKEQLARLFGVTRPALVNVMKQLSDDEIIAIDKRKITLLNKNALLSMI